MKEIGSGAQYRVFDRGDGRVQKKRLTTDETQDVLTYWYGDSEEASQLAAKSYGDQALRGVKTVVGILAAHPEFASYVGYPVFYIDGDYSQEKLTVLEDIFEEGDLDKSKKAVDSYAELLLGLWKYGVSDRVFNPGINSGIDKDGYCVLLDFGELQLEKDQVVTDATNKRWQESWFYKHAMSPELKEYYRREMDTLVTVERVEEHWLTA